MINWAQNTEDDDDDDMRWIKNLVEIHQKIHLLVFMGFSSSWIMIVPVRYRAVYTRAISQMTPTNQICWNTMIGAWYGYLGELSYFELSYSYKFLYMCMCFFAGVILHTNIHQQLFTVRSFCCRYHVPGQAYDNMTHLGIIGTQGWQVEACTQHQASEPETWESYPWR